MLVVEIRRQTARVLKRKRKSTKMIGKTPHPYFVLGGQNFLCNLVDALLGRRSHSRSRSEKKRRSRDRSDERKHKKEHKHHREEKEKSRKDDDRRDRAEKDRPEK